MLKRFGQFQLIYHHITMMDGVGTIWVICFNIGLKGLRISHWISLDTLFDYVGCFWVMLDQV